MFNKTEIEKINESASRLIGKDWMLITAGDISNFNTMTAAWGGLGFLWHKPVAFIFIRPNRYTFQFTEKSDHLTLTFFDEEHRDILQRCGSVSGRDHDKVSETGLVPVEHTSGAIYFEQARIVLICKKLYTHDLDPAAFLDSSIHEVYPQKDYHRMYFGEIEETLVRSGN